MMRNTPHGIGSVSHHLVFVTSFLSIAATSKKAAPAYRVSHLLMDDRIALNTIIQALKRRGHDCAGHTCFPGTSMGMDAYLAIFSFFRFKITDIN